jgi:hypothetical protein
MNKQCIVKGCGNKNNQGGFIGGLCPTCHEYLTSGKIGRTTSFLSKLPFFERENEELREQLESMPKTITSEGHCPAVTSVWTSPVSQIPHRCPVCEGRGIVPHGFYVSPSNQQTYLSSSAAPEVCKSCAGTGVIFS